MSSRIPLLPRFDSLESKTIKPADASTAPAAFVCLKPVPVIPSHQSDEDAVDLCSTKVELSGQALGFYTSREGPPDIGTRFQVNANGTISPFGLAFVTGSFHTFGSARGIVATGTLTIAGRQGKRHLALTYLSPAAVGKSTDTADAANPREMMTTGTNATTSEPAVVMNTFRFEIKSGTGHYMHDRGTGTVRIETRPALGTSRGPAATYSSSLASTAETGQTILTFTPA
jgi:hypothetical protein